jgi:hypothetical protein
MHAPLPKTERPPRGGLSEIRSGVLIWRLLQSIRRQRLSYVEPTKLLAADRFILAFAMVMRALSEWQTGHDIAQILDAVL